MEYGGHLARYVPLRSERVQKRNQIGFLLGRETNVEMHIVKKEYICQRRRRTIVKVRRTTCKRAENGTFHFSYVRPPAGNESATRIGCLDGYAGSVVYQSEHWEIADI